MRRHSAKGKKSSDIEEIVSGALFDLGGRLTTLDKDIEIGAHSEAGQMAEIIDEFCKERGVMIDNADVTNWQERISSELTKIGKMINAFRPKDMWQIAEKAVKFIKSEYGQSAYADEIMLPTDRGQQAGPIKLFYNRGNDYLWMLREDNGFKIDYDQVRDPDDKRNAKNSFKKNKIYKSWSDFSDDLANFKAAESFTFASDEYIASELVKVAKLLSGFKDDKEPLNKRDKDKELIRAKMRVEDAWNKAFKKSGDPKSADMVMNRAIILRLSRIKSPVKMWATAEALENENFHDLAKKAFDMLKKMGYKENGQSK